MRIMNQELRIKHKEHNSLFLSLNSKGLTLVEVLIAMGIAVITGSLLFVIIVNSSGLFYKQSSRLQEGLNSNDALMKFRQSIKEASSIDSTSTAEKLVLKISSIDSSGNLIDNTYDNFEFYKDQKFLRFKVTPDALSSRKLQDQIFSNSVENLYIQYFNSAIPPLEVSPQLSSKVRISLTLKQKAGADYEISISTSEGSLRND